jgi:hypothetical protein
MLNFIQTNNGVDQAEDNLQQIAVVGDDHRAFSVEIDSYEPDLEDYDTLPQALRRAAELFEYEPTERVTVRNTTTGAVVFDHVNPNYVHPRQAPENFEEENPL